MCRCVRTVRMDSDWDSDGTHRHRYRRCCRPCHPFSCHHPKTLARPMAIPPMRVHMDIHMEADQERRRQQRVDRADRFRCQRRRPTTITRTDRCSSSSSHMTSARSLISSSNSNHSSTSQRIYLLPLPSIRLAPVRALHRRLQLQLRLRLHLWSSPSLRLPARRSCCTRAHLATRVHSLLRQCHWRGRRAVLPFRLCPSSLVRTRSRVISKRLERRGPVSY